MGSKKQRTEKKLKRAKKKPYIPRQTSAKKEDTKITSAYSSTPLYTALFMILGIVVLAFIFTIMLNTVITDIYMKDHPELANDTATLKTAVEAYINTNPVCLIAQRIVLNVAGILAMMMLFSRLEKKQFPSIVFVNNGKVKVDIGMGVLFSFLAVLVAYNILAVIGYVTPTGALAFNPIQLLWTVDFIFMCIFEEAFFRGYAIYKLGSYNTNVAIIVSSFLFALYRGLPSTMLSTYVTYIIMGIVLSYSAVKLKSLWFPLTFRFIWTFTSGILLSIYSAVVPGIVENTGLKESLLSGNKAGFENGFIAAIILLICYVIIRKIIEGRNTPKQRRLHPDGTIR